MLRSACSSPRSSSVFGPSLYRAMGGEGASLEAALSYSNVVFAGAVLVWLMNALASVLRGTGNMLVPSVAICVGVALLVPLSPSADLRLRSHSSHGHRRRRRCRRPHHRPHRGGDGLVHLVRPQRRAPQARAPAQGAVRRYPARGRSRFGQHACRPRWSSRSPPRWWARAGGPDAVAGYGTGARLEYLLIPLVFGLGAPLVALVGTNIGAGQRARALRIALIGGGARLRADRGDRARRGDLAACVAGAVRQRSTDARDRAARTCALSARRMAFSVWAWRSTSRRRAPGVCSGLCSAGFLRLVIAIGGGWLALRVTGSLHWLFAALALGLVVYGVSLIAAIGSGVWFARDQRSSRGFCATRSRVPAAVTKGRMDPAASNPSHPPSIASASRRRPMGKPTQSSWVSAPSSVSARPCAAVSPLRAITCSSPDGPPGRSSRSLRTIRDQRRQCRSPS